MIFSDFSLYTPQNTPHIKKIFKKNSSKKYAPNPKCKMVLSFNVAFANFSRSLLSLYVFRFNPDICVKKIEKLRKVYDLQITNNY